MRLSVLLPLCLLLASCGSNEGKGPGKTDDGPPEWVRGKPSIDGRDLVPGHPFNLTIGGVPSGATVSFFRSETGPGPGGECLDAWDSVCTLLADAEVVATLVADDSGITVYSLDVPEDEPPRVVYYQALMDDPETGAMIGTSVLQRHIAVPPDRAAVAFINVDVPVGLGSISTGGNSHTGGAAWVDANGDYLPDLFVTNSTEKAHRLYMNRGNATFEDWSDRVLKPDPLLESAGVQFADIDNDGDQDILVVVDSHRPMNVNVPQDREGGPNLLYLNDGQANFTEVGEAWNIRDPRGWRNSCGAFGDYDRDGWIDLYLCAWAVLSEPYGLYDKSDRLLRNTGNGSFVEVPGIDGEGRDALVARFVDLDQDLWPELYVGNVAEHWTLPEEDPRDILYWNEEGSLVDRTTGQMGDGGDAWAAMGTTLGDIDNDGLWEFYVTDHWDYEPGPRGNPLYTVGADGNLSDNICQEHGVCAGYLSWPANFADFDNDGWVDLWVGTAWTSHNDLVYMNRGDGTFALHAQEEMTDNATHGGAVADFDLDGDLDIFLFSDIGRSHLYANEPAVPGHWLELRPLGTTSNRSAIGAVVRANIGQQQIMRMVSGADSAHSQSALTVHLGLGDSPGANLEITWPSGRVQDLGLVPADRFLLVDEDLGLVPETIVAPTAVHDVTGQLFTVSTGSSHHGRSRFTLMPMNKPMIFDIETRTHSVELAVDQLIPPVVQLIGATGESWDVVVTVQ